MTDDFEKSLESFKDALDKIYNHDSVLTLELTDEDARGLLSCIQQTMVKGTHRDIGLKISKQLEEFIYKK
jgi:hypothetical protein